MRHNYTPKDYGVNRWGGTSVQATCSCGWEGWERVSYSRKSDSSTRRGAEKMWRNHREHIRVKARWAGKQMELLGRTRSHEVWIVNLYGVLPPPYKLVQDRLAYEKYPKHPITASQVEIGKVWPWMVFTRTLSTDNWRHQGTFRTKEDAITSGKRRWLGIHGAELGVRDTTFTPRSPSFEQYLKRLATEVNRATTPTKQAAMIKKLRKINAAFELVEQAQDDMIRRMAGL